MRRPAYYGLLGAPVRRHLLRPRRRPGGGLRGDGGLLLRLPAARRRLHAVLAGRVRPRGARRRGRHRHGGRRSTASRRSSADRRRSTTRSTRSGAFTPTSERAAGRRVPAVRELGRGRLHRPAAGSLRSRARGPPRRRTSTTATSGWGDVRPDRPRRRRMRRRSRRRSRSTTEPGYDNVLVEVATGRDSRTGPRCPTLNGGTTTDGADGVRGRLLLGGTRNSLHYLTLGNPCLADRAPPASGTRSRFHGRVDRGLVRPQRPTRGRRSSSSSATSPTRDRRSRPHRR